jgi:hypothetical protein
MAPGSRRGDDAAAMEAPADTLLALAAVVAAAASYLRDPAWSR